MRQGAGRGYPPGMPEVGANPFRPGRGVLPPLITGRERELEMAEERLATLAGGESPTLDLLFYGPRGNGKTTLRLEVERRARERRLRVERFPAAALTDHARLVRQLQERAGVLGGRVTGVQVASVGLTETPPAPTEDIDRLFASWVGADGARPTVITLDEVQALDPDTAWQFFEAIQDAKPGPAPFLVLAAGTPDAPRRLREAATFNERGFVNCRIGRLDRSATLAALREPARASGKPFTEDAAGFLAEQSQDYPFFIQLLGNAAWEAASEGASEISPRDARTGAAECAGHIEDFYEGRYQEARARGVAAALRPLARRFAEQEGRLTESQLETLLRRLGDEPTVSMGGLALEQELTDLGVVWSVRTGVWEMGIPSFADYLLRRG